MITLKIVAIIYMITLTGAVERVPIPKPMQSYEECEQWARQQSYMHTLPGYSGSYIVCTEIEEREA